MKIKELVPDIYVVNKVEVVNPDTWEDHKDHKKYELLGYATGKLNDIESAFKAQYPDCDIEVEKLDLPYDAEVSEITAEFGKKSRKLLSQRKNLQSKLDRLKP